jgi:monovalent cation:H+ antiporter, CPA1 family
LLDKLLNPVLFVLIGLEVLVLSFQRSYLLAGLAAIPLVLAARWLSVALHVKAFSFVRDFSEQTITILTWGGLRGGISVALALSLPLGATSDAVVMNTDIMVIFPILVQGFTTKRVLGMGTGSQARHSHA